MIYQLLKILLRESLSDRTLYLAGTQATSADIDTLYLSVNNRAHTLDIRLPLALRPDMGMADMHAGLHSLRANFADSCHSYTSSPYTDTAESPHTQCIYSNTGRTGMQAFLFYCFF